MTKKGGIKPVHSTVSEYVNGFTIDLKNNMRAASFANKTVAVWDIRTMNKEMKPIGSISETKPIEKISFCPSKSNRLAVLTADAEKVKMYNLEGKSSSLRIEPIQCKCFAKLQKIFQ